MSDPNSMTERANPGTKSLTPTRPICETGLRSRPAGTGGCLEARGRSAPSEFAPPRNGAKACAGGAGFRLNVPVVGDGLPPGKCQQRAFSVKVNPSYRRWMVADLLPIQPKGLFSN